MGAFEAGDEAVVRETVLTSGGADLDLPEAAEVAFFLAAALELVGPGVEQCLFGGAVLLASAPHKTLCVFQQSFTAAMSGFSSFDSRHMVIANLQIMLIY